MEVGRFRGTCSGLQTVPGGGTKPRRSKVYRVLYPAQEYIQRIGPPRKIAIVFCTSHARAKNVGSGGMGRNIWGHGGPHSGGNPGALHNAGISPLWRSPLYLWHTARSDVSRMNASDRPRRERHDRTQHHGRRGRVRGRHPAHHARPRRPRAPAPRLLVGSKDETPYTTRFVSLN